ncbi:hypothetical protein B0H63DRAFT_240927 [Podospora didyma]|uniref:DUF6594 domain-containing protein n=1 Tax=Podospora didyma TaxID=330526 RepID=A0AAE0NCC2_9PEZI|nr:hypothetical protein B0H63DRAFT_240927 [Podospora didyma]
MPNFAPSIDAEERGIPDDDRFVDQFMAPNKCRYFDQYHELPLGWPRQAGIDEQFPSEAIFHSFSYSLLILLRDAEMRAAFLQSKLFEFHAQNKDLRGLNRHQTRLPGQPVDEDDEYKKLLDEQYEALTRYDTLVFQYRQMKQLHPVPRPQFRDTFRHMVAGRMFNREVYDVWMASPDEFVSIDEPLRSCMINIFYSAFGKWLMAKFASKGNEEQSCFPRHSVIIGIGRAFHVLVIVPLVAVPLGILFLYEMTLASSLGLILGCTVLFSCVMMAATQKAEAKETVLVICAYIAVLGGISAQLASANTRSC